MEWVKAGANKRVCAFLVDSVIMLLFTIAFFFVTGKDYGWIIYTLLIVLKDGVDGQSPGKRFVGLQVLDENNQPAPPMTTMIRNILLALPLLPLIEYIVMLRDKEQGLRLGDKMAKTKVTDLRPEEPDQKYLWISLAIAAVAIAIQIMFGAYLHATHPEMFEVPDKEVNQLEPLNSR